MSTNDLFTCVTCNIAFNDSELQRAHYKTDWHRYNLKRKVAEMPAISLQDFNERVQLQKIQVDSAQVKTNDEMFCKLCSKHFSNENSYTNHKNSKKHKDLEAANKVNDTMDQDTVAKSDRAEKRAQQQETFLRQQEKLAQEIEVEEEELLDDDDKNWEDIGDDEEMDQFDESKGIPLTECFFCDHKSNTVEEKCEHMAKLHSFFIPDMEHCTDLEGLLKFLGIKLGVYHVCLWCSGKCYRDLLSVKKHMTDKGHQKVKFEGDNLLEYVDFYTYDDEGNESDSEFEMLNESNFTMIDSDLNSQSLVLSRTNSKIESVDQSGDTYELVLPSGARIGHRSLFRYYKQSFGHRNLELKRANNLTLRDKYLAISCNGCYNPTETKKVRKDLAYFQRWNAKMRTKLGWETNKLQKHFRRQDLCF